MKDKNENLLVAISLFFVIFLAPFNLMMSLVLALALATAYLAFRLMRTKKTKVKKTVSKKGKRKTRKGVNY